MLGTRYAANRRRRRRPHSLNWWQAVPVTPWAIYQPKGAASLAASYTDLSGSGHDAGVGVAPAWDAVNGWKFNGTSQYLTTTFVPDTDQSQTALVQFSNVTNDGRLFAFRAANDRRFWIIPDTGGNTVGYANGDEIEKGPLLAAGNLAVAGSEGYRNGAAESITIPGWGGEAGAVFIGAQVAGFKHIAAYIQAIAFYASTLTAAQVLTLATEMAAL
jgi:hypothetical protein